MRKFDIISPSPQTFIFQKESNKTNLGGLLSIIYFISFLLICLTYGSIFFLNDKYEITSFNSELRELNDDELKTFEQSLKYNPYLKIKFSLFDENYKNLSDRFILVDVSTKEEIKVGEIIERRVNDIFINVFYKCDENETNCFIESKDLRDYYQMRFYYEDFIYNIQNDIPITKKKAHGILQNIHLIMSFHILKWIFIQFMVQKLNGI